MSPLLRLRRPFVFFLHMALAAVSNYIAVWLRFEGIIPEEQQRVILRYLPLLLGVRALAFWRLGLFHGLWRYTSLHDLVAIIGAVVLSSTVFYGILRLGLGVLSYPRSVYILDALILVCFLGGLRLARRFVRELTRLEQEKTVLIYGAGDAGEMILRDIRNNSSYNYKALGFVDDNRSKVGLRIHGVRVLGGREALPRIMEAYKPDEVLIAIPTAMPGELRRIVQALRPYKVPIKTIPNLRDLPEAGVNLEQVRDLAVGDLLTRAPVDLDLEPIRTLVAGKRVLVTGAGGSIGSELCRQVARLEPERLVMLERYENSLFQLEHEIEGTLPRGRGMAVIADITHAGRIDRVMADVRPHIVFHAAAHKHVPFMEEHPCEAVKNNIFGTLSVAEAADRHGVDRFILISSDKAVNPTNVMGATKRVCEFIVQAVMRESATRFSAVRFGNVLGSNGSVVPRFLEQVRRGGPVTVTHPEMRRFFMLIPEAVQLVQLAGALSEPGTVYVLDMGDQIRVVDLARTLIQLSGFVPDEEIAIVYTGLRPGEKLFEELVGRDETVSQSAALRVLQVRPGRLPEPSGLRQHLAVLDRFARHDDAQGVVRTLREIVPTYQPDPRWTTGPERPRLVGFAAHISTGH